ncbi:hypothetical protein [Bradyrhizobium elkanii]|uniref:hypothetical protein n=1 Tax=Bradyrhizobium elkanii TaxID=29448 RepID=UPI00056ECA18|nr:hypothetical protein [Bradyrhizobium elkanii]WLA85831.1 hypothetical protein QNJ99_17420 [Bradyrhizobium elkanii]
MKAVGFQMIFARGTTFLLALIGALLLGICLLGELINFNRPSIDIPAARPNQSARSYEWVARRLAVIDATRSSRSTFNLVYTLNTIVHERMVNYDDRDNQVISIFSVSLFDNWLLWAAGRIDPRRYRDLFLLDPHLALWRGLGMCGQSSLALVGLLNERSIRAGILGLDNHVVAWAESGDNHDYVIADPDYGVVIAANLAEIKSKPALIDQAYQNVLAAQADYPPYDLTFRLPSEPEDEPVGGYRTKLRRLLHAAYQNASEATKYPAGVDNSFGETVAGQRYFYIAKWAIPLAMLLPALVILASRPFRLWRRKLDHSIQSAALHLLPRDKI